MTKQQILIETARKLFFKHGIRRVTVAEICAEAGVSKMTFYKYYDNKAALAKAFLLEAYKKGMADYRNVMQQQIPFAEKVHRLIQMKLRDTEDISQEFIKDVFNDTRLGLREILEVKKQEQLREILSDFAKAAANGEIRPDIKPQFIVYFLEKIREMTMDENLRKLYQNEQEVIMELTNFFFYGLGIAYGHEHT